MSARLRAFGVMVTLGLILTVGTAPAVSAQTSDPTTVQPVAGVAATVLNPDGSGTSSVAYQRGSGRLPAGGFKPDDTSGAVYVGTPTTVAPATTVPAQPTTTVASTTTHPDKPDCLPVAQITGDVWQDGAQVFGTFNVSKPLCDPVRAGIGSNFTDQPTFSRNQRQVHVDDTHRDLPKGFVGNFTLGPIAGPTVANAPEGFCFRQNDAWLLIDGKRKNLDAEHGAYPGACPPPVPAPIPVDPTASFDCTGLVVANPNAFVVEVGVVVYVNNQPVIGPLAIPANGNVKLSLADLANYGGTNFTVMWNDKKLVEFDTKVCNTVSPSGPTARPGTPTTVVAELPKTGPGTTTLWLIGAGFAALLVGLAVLYLLSERFRSFRLLRLPYIRF